MPSFSPVMQQYFAIKEKYPNTILFFRLGDFYEMFYNDAKTVSQELELTLTGKECGQEERAPMCGVPFHSAETYIARLVEKGYKVAICEQMENPKETKTLVKRDVIRVITPGTVLESSMLDETKNNYIASLFYSGLECGVCFADISTGELFAQELSAGTDFEAELKNILSRYMPSELLINPQTADLKWLPAFIRDSLKCSLECTELEQERLEEAEAAVEKQFGAARAQELSLSKRPGILFAISKLLLYLERTQITGIERLDSIEIIASSASIYLDLNARRNLELTETIRNKEYRGSLLWVLDKTKTAMGKRLIKNWLMEPLLSPVQITLRQNAVEELVNSQMLRDGVTDALTGIYDLERIMTRIVYGTANARELRALCSALSRLPQLKAAVQEAGATLIKELNAGIDPLSDVAELIDAALIEDPPFSIREGGMIKEGYNAELDETRVDMRGGQDLIASVEAREKERTGIPKLKIGYNRVFGYYIEVSNMYREKVPEEYIRKQTISSGERFITDELKQLENRILGASDRAVAMESRLFDDIRKKVASELARVQQTAKAVAVLDVLCSFAAVSVKNDYTRPVVNMSGKIYIKDGRHPVVEQLLRDAPFVPNDTDMDMNDNRTAIITGPNMAGKSTFMRQVAIITIMAQTGCFVPASVAEIGIVDAVFTRVGASDDLSAGQSTFMLEMSEVADILKNATKNSLLIFDEIGRGTSTFDGMSIARAVLEYVSDKRQLGAKTLFATHYHELTVLEQTLPGVRNFNVAVKKKGDDITFLRRIVRGGADDSYGIEVAKLAGVPDRVIRRAKEVLKELESGDPELLEKTAKRFAEEPVQLTMDTPEAAVVARLRAVDVNSLTPMECMNVLFEITNILKQ